VKGPGASLSQGRAVEAWAGRVTFGLNVKETTMPDHIRMILKHGLIGFGISVAFTAMILVFNIGNLWHLVTHTTEGPVAVAMLIIFGTVTFGSAQIGYMIMSMGEDEDDDQGGKRDALPVADPVAIPINAQGRS